MRCAGFCKRIVPCVLTVGISLFAVNVLKGYFADKNQEKPLTFSAQSYQFEKETGTAFCRGLSNEKVEHSKLESPLIITSRPQPKYTDRARQNEIIGKVVLRVTFLASGEVGKISVVTGLPDGLTEQAIAAAMQAKFKPPIRDGKPITVSKTVIYSFTPY